MTIEVENPLWLDSKIQFPRLISEIVATCELNAGELCESMDISVDELNDLLDRANRLWEIEKAVQTGFAVAFACPSCPNDELEIIGEDKNGIVYLTCTNCKSECAVDENGLLIDLS